MINNDHPRRNGMRVTMAVTILLATIMAASCLSNVQNLFAQSGGPRNSSVTSDEPEEDQSKLIPLAKITSDEATQIAVKNVSAQTSDVKSIELEDENGDVVYSVDVTQGDKPVDVKVDAVSGNVLRVQQDDLEQNDTDVGDIETNDTK
ncbi:MAG: PepSY domain-containing protein [Candidatus Nitrosocosmicus sp.]